MFRCILCCGTAITANLKKTFIYRQKNSSSETGAHTFGAPDSGKSYCQYPSRNNKAINDLLGLQFWSKMEFLSAIHRFQCKSCTFQTALKCNLTNHTLAVHEKRKPFKCKQCIFESFRKKQLTQHIENVHIV